MRAFTVPELRDWLLDHQQETADTMQLETGKVRAEAMTETPYITDLINFYGRKARKFIGDERVPAHSPLMKVKRLRVQYRPYPVVGVISPWNFPLILSAAKWRESPFRSPARFEIAPGLHGAVYFSFQSGTRPPSPGIRRPSADARLHIP